MADIISGKSRFDGSDKIGKNPKVIKLAGDDTYSTQVNKQAAEKIRKHRRNVIIGAVIVIIIAIIASSIVVCEYYYLDILMEEHIHLITYYLHLTEMILKQQVM